jgi:hypothetical protein
MTVIHKTFEQKIASALPVILKKRFYRNLKSRIEKNIGISKDYNNFELQKAVGEKNILKSNMIVQNSLIGGGGISKMKRWTGSEWKSVNTIIIYK